MGIFKSLRWRYRNASVLSVFDNIDAGLYDDNRAVWERWCRHVRGQIDDLMKEIGATPELRRDLALGIDALVAGAPEDAVSRRGIIRLLASVEVDLLHLQLTGASTAEVQEFLARLSGGHCQAVAGV